MFFQEAIAVLLLFPPLLAVLTAILDLSVTTTSILPFGACYVILHKVYWVIAGCFVGGKDMYKKL